MPSHSTRVDVVIVGFNSRTFIDECLSSLESQNYPRELVSLIFVDNGSTDGSGAHVRRTHPHVTVVERQHNGGFGAGVNTGIAHGTAEIIVLLNSDARAHPDFITELVSSLQKSEHIAAVTAKIILEGKFEPSESHDTGFVSYDGWVWKRAAEGVPLLNSTGLQITRSGNGRDRDWLRPVDSPEPPTEVFGFTGGAAALRRSALDDVGFFDERLFMYYEDVDLSWRIRLSGWQIHYASSAIAFHQHAASSDATSPAFRTWNETNRALVAIKNGTPSIVFRALGRTLLHALKIHVGSSHAGCQNGAGHLEPRRRLSVLVSLMRRAPQFARDRRNTSPRDRHRVAQFTLPE